MCVQYLPVMTKADLSTPRAGRLGVAVLVIALHLLAFAGLIRAFAPDFSAKVAEHVVTAFTVTVTTPPPSPSPPPPDPASEKAGVAAPAGKQATPREVTAPRPKTAIARDDAPEVPGKGSADAAGARDQGDGTGAGGQGVGTGSGAGGDGTGSGGAAKAVKIAGEISSARDYPRETRDARIGDHVIVALTVGTDGRVRGCRIVRASRDPQADQITCRLATDRFRFRPATNAAGEPVESVFGWKQRWFYPGKDS